MKNKLSVLFLGFALLVGLFMRGWQYRERFMYNHDNDLSSWIVRDVLVNHHFRLIGQQTSEPGIFIGPLFYYSLIPFYILFQMDPIGGVILPILICLAAIISIYYVALKLHGRVPASIASLVYAASLSLSINERDVVPTTPVLLWSIWLYYAVNRLYQGKKPLWLVALLFGLVWHFNLALVLLAPLVLIGFVKNLRLYHIKDFILPIFIFISLSTPLILFEARHNFIQTNALVSSLTRIESKDGLLVDKVAHVLLYASRNSTGIVHWDWPYSVYIVPAVLIAGMFFLAFKKYIPRYTLIIFFSWILLYILFFTSHPINLSEYYLNGMNVLTVISLSLILSYIYSRNMFGKVLVVTLTTYLVFYNIFSFYKSPINHSGYVMRTAIVNFIKNDAFKHGYPCVSVSYITNPGYNLGYRYLFWLTGLKVNQPISGSPVYTIVFPHSLVDRMDHTFGALGLILPNYSQYTQHEVAQSCSGADSNITDPMFGYTE